MNWKCDENVRAIAWHEMCVKEMRSLVLNDKWAQGNALNVKRMITPCISQRRARFLSRFDPPGPLPSSPTPSRDTAVSPVNSQRRAASTIPSEHIQPYETSYDSYGWESAAGPPRRNPRQVFPLPSTDVTRMGSLTKGHR
jgi:hypothetical protein